MKYKKITVGELKSQIKYVKFKSTTNQILGGFNHIYISNSNSINFYISLSTCDLYSPILKMNNIDIFVSYEIKKFLYNKFYN